MRVLAFILTAIAAGAHGKLPVAFEPNQGQAPGQVQFLAHGRGYSLALQPGRAELRARGGRISAALVGARATNGQAEAKLPGVVNYLAGDAAASRSGIPTYARVRYREVYPGIDVVYYGNEGQLEYDFVLAPGADARRIAVRYEGARRLRLDAAGDLVLETASGEMRQHRPELYQENHGVRRRISGRYLLRGQTVRFEVGAYDHARPLVIDPALTWATYFGSTGDDGGQAVAADSSGNIYMAGYSATAAEGYDAFVTKISPDGTTALYTTVLPGNGDDLAFALAVDGSGNAYFAGETTSSNLPQAGYLNNTNPGSTLDAFVAKLDTTGKLAYFNYLGGSGAEAINGMAIDAAGNAYVVGSTNSPDFPVSSGVAQTAPAGGVDIFVTKFDPTGKGVYSTYLGGGGDDFGNSIAVDSSGNVFLTGTTASSNFPVTLTAYQPRTAGGSDAFITKLSPSGGLVFSTYLGGTGFDSGNAIAIDSSGAVYVAGQTASGDFPTLNPLQKALNGNSDIFVAKLNGSGATLAYSTFLGGSADEIANAIALDSANNVYITGQTFSTDYPVQDAFQATAPGSAPALVTALNTAGSALLFSSYLGGNGANTSTASGGNVGDVGNGIFLSCPAGLLVAGNTTSTNLPVTAGALRTSYQGGAGDAFLARLGVGGTPAVPAGAVLNSASSGAGPVAPGSLISVFGSALALATQTAALTPWPNTLGGASVAINGAAAPIYYASPTQMNVQVPYEAQNGSASLTVTAPCGTSVPVTFQVAASAPYIFQSADAVAITQNQDFSINSANNPAKVGSVVTVYLTGIGPLDNPVPTGAPAPATTLSRATLPIHVTIGGFDTVVQFLGLTPGFIGLAQANLFVPNLSPGRYPISITIGGVASNAANMWVN